MWNICRPLSSDVDILEEYSSSSPFLIEFWVCLKFPHWWDSDWHSQLEVCIDDVTSFSGHHIRWYMTSICLSLVVIILISQSRSCPMSPLYDYWFLFSLVTKRQSVRRHCKTMQISWFLQKNPLFSIHRGFPTDGCKMMTFQL